MPASASAVLNARRKLWKSTGSEPSAVGRVLLLGGRRHAASRAEGLLVERGVRYEADGSEQLRLRYERQALRHYASFSLEAAAQQVVAEMDAE